MSDPFPFLERIFDALTQCEVGVEGMELDHLCYRVEDMERYMVLRKELGDRGTLLSESVVSGRPIATYRLTRPFLYEGRRIDVIELPAPKPGSFYVEGFEHAEFVVDEELLTFTKRRPDLSWDLSGSSRTVNAEVRLRFDGFSVKFHREPLVQVIEKETKYRTKAL